MLVDYLGMKLYGLRYCAVLDDFKFMSCVAVYEQPCGVMICNTYTAVAVVYHVTYNIASLAMQDQCCYEAAGGKDIAESHLIAVKNDV